MITEDNVRGNCGSSMHFENLKMNEVYPLFQGYTRTPFCISVISSGYQPSNTFAPASYTRVTSVMASSGFPAASNSSALARPRAREAFSGQFLA
jgi:hypothetical protein